MTYDNEYEDTSDEPTVTEPVKPKQKYMGHLPLEIAKAMKPIIMGKHASSQPSLTQIYCEAIDDERKDRIVNALRKLEGQPKKDVLEKFKKDSHISAAAITPDHITTPEHGDLLETLLGLDPYVPAP